ncbi:MAG: excinuclease ABC subunit UvrA [Candidatus Omnitrophica bacterium CG07_land_8_20_14_0_80_42_15]|uniref:UvrABC system protein A n=1 Tax=Candidatus Aquitaenariimonas noxiae TaxID=1974741 RepID=A0A2J0KY12_9BACT|nr:MAG: excinuclease ABC subunit UvrA [Candidatus Omnitrophica bacterium CG07_land_8_20_14_0_80_42_15]
MENEYIFIKGAKEHNLKNIDVKIPRDKLVVITGLSGSGKSSLAFDTIYAEGQRRYVESLSSYARQFLEQLQKPDVEYIEGLSPAISIEQRTAGGNPRSTVGTQTEIYDYLRLLFARIGVAHCPQCGKEIKQQSSQEIIRQILELPKESKIIILAPVVRGRKGEYRELFRQVQKEGFIRARVDGKIYEIEKPIALDKNKKHNIEIVVDRFELSSVSKKRIGDSVETALKAGEGTVIINIDETRSGEDLVYSEQYACPDCGISFEELAPRMFSFNSPYGACPGCDGLGTKMEIDSDLVIPDKNKPVIDAIEGWRRGGKGLFLYYRRLMRSLAHKHNFDVDTPFKKLSPEIKKIILYGEEYDNYGAFEGVAPNLERRFRETESDYIKEEINKFMSVLPCPVCNGKRLKKESLAVTIKGKNIIDITTTAIKELKAFFDGMELTDKEKLIGYQAFKEIKSRLRFMTNVGLDYLTLDRRSSTLSGGEAQRIRLATQIGSGLVGVLYILDEPSIGLHQKDNSKLLDTLLALRDLGNTLIVVEHDEATIRKADYILDLGPGAGENGGRIIAGGPLKDIIKSSDSLTGKYLRGELQIPIPGARRKINKDKSLVIKGAKEHNLKNIDVTIPLGVFNCITGVSGSGKSTLVDDILYRALAKRLYRSKEKPGAYDKITGMEFIDKVIVIDQSPIGRTPRSNSATYTGVFTIIRDLFSKVPDSRVRGYKPGRFSFNVKGGRCETCGGDGIKKIEMHFLPDVYVTCEICKGKRFNEQTLEIKYKGFSINDVLGMSVDKAMDIFANIPAINSKLETLHDVGLGYIKLGQSATTLSGGEAQRIKLSAELSKRSTGRTLYILDEPTTGLHFADVDKLLSVLHRLTDAGNTVIVIEHNLDVIKNSDYIIDLGPEGGDGGGQVVVSGSPEKVADTKKSYTGQYLKKVLNGKKNISNLLVEAYEKNNN